jgi:hypothetical protein
VEEAGYERPDDPSVRLSGWGVPHTDVRPAPQYVRLGPGFSLSDTRVSGSQISNLTLPEGTSARRYESRLVNGSALLSPGSVVVKVRTGPGPVLPGPTSRNPRR